jgi:hypothetical protein
LTIASLDFAALSLFVLGITFASQLAQLELMGGDMFSLFPSIDDGPQSLISRRMRGRIPVDAFWSLTPYDAKTIDLIPNPLKRYSVGSNTQGLKVRKDGSIVIEMATTAPKDRDVNWLPVSDGPYFLAMRLYQPRPEILDGRYKLPDIQEVQGAAPSSRQ